MIGAVITGGYGSFTNTPSYITTDGYGDFTAPPPPVGGNEHDRRFICNVGTMINTR